MTFGRFDRLKPWSLARAGFGLTCALFFASAAAGCGGDDDPPAGSGGSTAGTGGSGGGGGGSGGSKPGDTAAPKFQGLTSAEAKTETRVLLTWPAATDDVTPGSRIAYQIYASTKAGSFDFSTPSVGAPSGATSALVSNLTPNTEHHFVVRAVDEAGNEDTNTVEKSATTPDQTAPRFAGATSVTAKTSRSLLVEWKPAKDKGTAESAMRYRVFVSKTPGGQNFSMPTATSNPGESSLLVTGMEPLTDYYVAARAVDQAGLEDTNTVERTARTPEGVPPVFLGARQAVAFGNAIKVYWAPATDNLTEPANIVYDIYQATTSGAQDYSKPTHTSEPAATSFLVSGLMPGTRYFYVVRARDTSGNSDANPIQVNARARGEVDSSAPNFAGVTSVTGTSPSTLVASWAAAADTVTPPERILYDVYVADASGGQNFATPSLTSAPGATSATITGLAPQVTRFVVVRARDEAGNFAQSQVQASGSTLAKPTADSTAPTWGAGPVVNLVASQPQQLSLTVTAATDDTSNAANIRYHVCAETLENNCLGAEFGRHIRATGDWGITALTLSGLVPRSTYFVYARAEDRAGNLETGNHFAAATTATSFSTNVVPILQDRCNSCHSFSFLTTVNVEGGYADPNVGTTCQGGQGTGCLKLVDPGDPELSLIYRKINPLGLRTPPFSATIPNRYSGSREPRTGSGLSVTPLSGAEDGAIRDWIEQGAFAN